MGYRTPPMSSSTVCAFGARSVVRTRPCELTWGYCLICPLTDAFSAEGLKSSTGGVLSISTGGRAPRPPGAAWGGWAKDRMPGKTDRRAEVKIVFFMETPNRGYLKMRWLNRYRLLS